MSAMFVTNHLGSANMPMDVKKSVTNRVRMEPIMVFLVSFGTMWKYLTLTGTIWKGELNQKSVTDLNQRIAKEMGFV